jgi:hypothetical protein
MSQIITSNALNNLQVDGAYVYLQPPTPIAGAGIATSLSGIVGTASWGPINAPQPFSDTASAYAAFGRSISDPFSLVTESLFAVNFASNFLGVRVSDGTDTAASVLVKDTGGTNGVTLTGKYSGTEGNNISVTLAVGSQSTVATPTMTATIARTGYPSEVFANLGNPSAGGFAANLRNAVNLGVSGVRGPSNLVVATASGASVLGFVAGTSTLVGGTNGATVTSVQQIGLDGTTGRTGLYALRGLGVQQFILAGNSDPTQYTALATFAASEGSFAIAALPSGTSTSTALTTKQTANYNSINGALVKDWLTFTDPTISQQRMVSPLGETLGLIASLPPEASCGNKPIQGASNFLSTERTGTPYSGAEAAQLEGAGILYWTNPIPRGNVFGLPHGQNASGLANTGQDTIAYTRMTNFLAASLAGLIGPFVGELQGTSPNDPTRAAAKAVLTTFLQNLQNANRISGYNVQLNTANNTPSSIAQGYMLATCQVQYLATVKFFIVSLIGGASVQISTGNIQ